MCVTFFWNDFGTANHAPATVAANGTLTLNAMHALGPDSGFGTGGLLLTFNRSLPAPAAAVSTTPAAAALPAASADASGDAPAEAEKLPAAIDKSGELPVFRLRSPARFLSPLRITLGNRPRNSPRPRSPASRPFRSLSTSRPWGTLGMPLGFPLDFPPGRHSTRH